MTGLMSGRTPTDVGGQYPDSNGRHKYQWKCSFCDEDADRQVDAGLGYRIPVCDAPNCRFQLKMCSKRPWAEVEAQLEQGRPKPAPAPKIVERTPKRSGSPGGKTYEVDPAAVANMKRVLAEKEAGAAEPEKETIEPAKPAKETSVEEKQMSKKDPTKYEDLTREDVARWAGHRRDGKSYKWIQKNDPLHPSTYALAKYLKEYGYRTNGTLVTTDEGEEVAAFDFASDLTEEDVAWWAAWRRQGKSYAYVEEHGRGNPSRPTVKRYLEQFGWHLNGQPVEKEPEAERPIPSPELPATKEALVPAANGNEATLATREESDLEAQLAAVQQLLGTLQAGRVQVSGKIRMELAVEVEL